MWIGERPGFHLLSNSGARNPSQLPDFFASSIVLLGVAAVRCNYWTVYQPQYFRETNRRNPAWGQKPVIFEAKYLTGDGKERCSILSASGWMGLSRHVIFVFGTMLAFSLSVPRASTGLIPYAMFTFSLFCSPIVRIETKCDALRNTDVFKKSSVV